MSFVVIKEYLRELSCGRTDRRTKPKSLTLFNFSWKVFKRRLEKEKKSRLETRRPINNLRREFEHNHRWSQKCNTFSKGVIILKIGIKTVELVVPRPVSWGLEFESKWRHLTFNISMYNTENVKVKFGRWALGMCNEYSPTIRFFCRIFSLAEYWIDIQPNILIF